MVTAFVVVTGVLALRALASANVPGAPQRGHWVLNDFRDAVYYPVRSLLDGRNPYDVAAHVRAYPVGAKFPLYSPLTLLVHAPFGLLPYRWAAGVYFLLTIALTLALARLALAFSGLDPSAARICGLAALVLASRPGQQNLLNGQCTLQVVIGASLALRHGRDRPWLAGLGAAVSTLKPTFGGPLLFLMLWRGETRAVAVGTTLAAAGVALVAIPLAGAAGGLLPLLASMRADYAGSLLGPQTHPALSAFRIDALALIGRFLGRAPAPLLGLATAAGILGAAGLGLRRLAARHGDALGLALASVATLLCTYHQPYDLLLLVAPATMLAVERGAPPAPAARAALLTLLLLPAVNYLATTTVIDALDPRREWWLVLTSINGAALLGAWLILVDLALRPRR